MFLRTETINPKKLAGMRMRMSFARYHPYELWNRFMPRRKEIGETVGTDLWFVADYPAGFFTGFSPEREFERWAAGRSRFGGRDLDPDQSQRKMKHLPCFLLLFLLPVMAFRADDPARIYHDYRLLAPAGTFRNLFRTKDVVFLGENHRIMQQVKVVSGLIPDWQNMGVHLLFSEFSNYSDTRTADSLLVAPVYNEKLIYGLIRRSGWDWAWQEYADIYRAAWETNHRRQNGELPFRIIGLQPDLDYDAIQSQSDWDIPEKRKAYWNYDHNKTWTQIIETEALSKNQKAVIHCGWHHAFSSFHHPIVIDGKFVRFEKDREGTDLLSKHPGKIATALIYNAMPAKPSLDGPMIQPFGGAIDSLISTLPVSRRQFGFLTHESKLGSLRDSTVFYTMGYGMVTLSDMCDAVIVAGPVCEYRSATPVVDFVDSASLKNCIIQAYPYSFTREWSVKSMNDSLGAWAIDNQRYIDRIRQSCQLSRVH